MHRYCRARFQGLLVLINAIFSHFSDIYSFYCFLGLNCRILGVDWIVSSWSLVDFWICHAFVCSWFFTFFVFIAYAWFGCWSDIRRLARSLLLNAVASFCRPAIRRLFSRSVSESAWQSANASSEFWYWIKGWTLFSVHTGWRVSWFSDLPSAYSVQKHFRSWNDCS